MVYREIEAGMAAAIEVIEETPIQYDVESGIIAVKNSVEVVANEAPEYEVLWDTIKKYPETQYPIMAELKANRANRGWLQPAQSQTSAVAVLAERVGKEYDTTRTRVSEMHKKDYLRLVRTRTSNAFNSELITNIQLTRKGIIVHDIIQEKYPERTNLIDEKIAIRVNTHTIEAMRDEINFLRLSMKMPKLTWQDFDERPATNALLSKTESYLNELVLQYEKSRVQ